MFPRSRGAMRPSCALTCALEKTEGVGNAGRLCTRSRAWCVVNTRVSHHGYTGSPGIPARSGFNGFLRALLGDRAFLSPSPRRYRRVRPVRADIAIRET
jgi:hypothetical protein